MVLKGKHGGPWLQDKLCFLLFFFFNLISLVTDSWSFFLHHIKYIFQKTGGFSENPSTLPRAFPQR